MAKRTPGPAAKPVSLLRHSAAASPDPKPPAKNSRPRVVSEPVTQPASLKPKDEVADELQIVFGEHLKAARIAAGLNQAELAERTGLTQQYLSRIETGQRNVTLRTMIELANVLGQEVSAMLQRPKRRP